MRRASISVALRERIAMQGRNRCGYCLSKEEVTGVPLEMLENRSLEKGRFPEQVKLSEPVLICYRMFRQCETGRAVEAFEWQAKL